MLEKKKEGIFPTSQKLKSLTLSGFRKRHNKADNNPALLSVPSATSVHSYVRNPSFCVSATTKTESSS